MHERAKYTRSSHPETRGLQLYLKRDSSTGVFLWILGNFLYREHIWRLLLNMLLASFEYLTSKTTTPANIYLFKVSNRNIRKRFEMCLKLAIKNQSDNNDVVLVFLSLVLNIFHILFCVPMVVFEQVIVSWDWKLRKVSILQSVLPFTSFI